jgi:hypothetical protein
VSHPTIAEVLANQAEESDALRELNEVLITCLVDAGLDHIRVGLFHQVLSAYVIGTGLLEASWGHPDGRSRAASRRWYGALDPERYPNCVATAPSLFPPEVEVFDFAIDLFIRAVEAAAGPGVRRRPTPTRPTSRSTTRTTTRTST